LDRYCSTSSLRGYWEKAMPPQRLFEGVNEQRRDLCITAFRSIWVQERTKIPMRRSITQAPGARYELLLVD
jgi:hypothetical protein